MLSDVTNVPNTCGNVSDVKGDVSYVTNLWKRTSPKNTNMPGKRQVFDRDRHRDALHVQHEGASFHEAALHVRDTSSQNETNKEL